MEDVNVKENLVCGYMEDGECNTCAECMSCPENNKSAL